MAIIVNKVYWVIFPPNLYIVKIIILRKCVSTKQRKS